MRYLNLFYFLVIVTFANPALSQDADEVVDQEPTTVEALLALVKEGKVKEQAENARREAVFLADKNKQASILAAEKRELARQERIADKLEAEYKANQEILRVKEEAYKKELLEGKKILDSVLEVRNSEFELIYWVINSKE